MIESFEFVSDSGYSVMFNDDEIPFERFSTDVGTRTEELDRLQEHGMWPAYTYLGRRLFVAEGRILAQTSAEYWAKRMEILKALAPYPELGTRKVGTLKIAFTGFNERITSDVTIESYPEIPLESLRPSSSAFQVIWKAFDPILYGEDIQTSSVPFFQDVPVGRTYDKTFDKTYPAGGITGSDTLLTNSGNYVTYPVVAIYGPATDPTLRRTDTDEFVHLSGLTIAAGSWVTLDFRQRTALLADVYSVYEYTSGSTWFNLPPGDSPIRFTAFAASSPSRADWYWRNAYMI